MSDDVVIRHGPFWRLTGSSEIMNAVVPSVFDTVSAAMEGTARRIRIARAVITGTIEGHINDR